jgi:hypothetical protein
MVPGMAAARFIETQGGTAQASVIGTRFRTTSINAALAVAEKEGRSGLEVIRAVALADGVGAGPGARHPSECGGHGFDVRGAGEGRGVVR